MDASVWQLETIIGLGLPQNMCEPHKDGDGERPLALSGIITLCPVIFLMYALALHASRTIHPSLGIFFRKGHLSNLARDLAGTFMWFHRNSNVMLVATELRTSTKSDNEVSISLHEK